MSCQSIKDIVNKEIDKFESTSRMYIMQICLNRVLFLTEKSGSKVFISCYTIWHEYVETSVSPQTQILFRAISHCLKSFQMRNFLWSAFSRIRNEHGKILVKIPYLVRMRGKYGSEKTSYLDTFHAVPVKRTENSVLIKNDSFLV